ncbi:MAG: lytic transglycosylase domain-containing protein [Pseudomonadota bacterium]
MRLLLAAAAALCAFSSTGSSAADAFAPAAVSFAYKARHDAAPEADTVTALAMTPPDIPPVSQALEEVPPAPPTPPRAYTRRELCSAAASFAEANNLPVPFFANLIWQESGFKPHVVSRAGAQGIAQFMPPTAQAYGLDNPFDPIHALATSAKFLNELLAQFGNLGLAAAAYNAGPKRVNDFMTRKRGLPTETRNYVRNITGAPAERWAGMKAKAADFRTPRQAPCVEVQEALVAEAETKAQTKLAQTKFGKGKGGFALASAESTPVKLPAKSQKTAALAYADEKKSGVAKTAAKAFGKIKLASADGAVSLAQLKAAAKVAPGGKIKIAGKVVAKPALKLVAPEKTKVAAKAVPAKKATVSKAKSAPAKKVKVAAAR